MDIAAIYASIGPAGCVLVLVGCAGLYIALHTFFYMTFVWKHFQKDFLTVQHQGGNCLRNLNSTNPLIVIVRDIVSTHASHSDDIRAEVGSTAILSPSAKACAGCGLFPSCRRSSGCWARCSAWWACFRPFPGMPRRMPPCLRRASGKP